MPESQLLVRAILIIAGFGIICWVVRAYWDALKAMW